MFFVGAETCTTQADHQRKEFHHRGDETPAGHAVEEQQGNRTQPESSQAASFPAAAGREGAGEELQQAEG